MIPKTGKKYATVDVLTAPIFSISLTYPKKAKPVETPPNHATDKKASDAVSYTHLRAHET